MSKSQFEENAREETVKELRKCAEELEKGDAYIKHYSVHTHDFGPVDFEISFLDEKGHVRTVEIY